MLAGKYLAEIAVHTPQVVYLQHSALQFGYLCCEPLLLAVLFLYLAVDILGKFIELFRCPPIELCTLCLFQLNVHLSGKGRKFFQRHTEGILLIQQLYSRISFVLESRLDMEAPAVAAAYESLVKILKSADDIDKRHFFNRHI